MSTNKYVFKIAADSHKVRQEILKTARLNVLVNTPLTEEQYVALYGYSNISVPDSLIKKEWKDKIEEKGVKVVAKELGMANDDEIPYTDFFSEEAIAALLAADITEEELQFAVSWSRKARAVAGLNTAKPYLYANNFADESKTKFPVAALVHTSMPPRIAKVIQEVSNGLKRYLFLSRKLISTLVTHSTVEDTLALLGSIKDHRSTPTIIDPTTIHIYRRNNIFCWVLSVTHFDVTGERLKESEQLFLPISANFTNKLSHHARKLEVEPYPLSVIPEEVMIKMPVGGSDGQRGKKHAKA